MPSIQFLGHSCFIVSNNEYSIIIDPFLNGNPQSPVKPEDVNVDFIALTHGHGDHIGDTMSIAKASGATVIAPFELASYCQKKGLDVHPMHIAGGRELPVGRLKRVPAWHGSAVMEGDDVIYTGNPCGFLLTIDDLIIYHAGDTGLFSDMGLIGSRNDIHTALLPIGDNFTMGIEDALFALELIGPKYVVPMHYNTFPVIQVDPNIFAAGAADRGFVAQCGSGSDQPRRQQGELLQLPHPS